MRFLPLLVIASLLAVPVFAAPQATTLALERPLPSSGEVGIPDVVTLAAGEAIPADPAPAPSLIGSFFGQFVTPANIAYVTMTLLGLIGGALHLTQKRKEQIAIVTQHAFHGVEDFAATTENTVDDKVAAGLKIANEWMAAQGWRALKPGETEVVKLGFNALNGATKMAERLQAAAIEASKPVPPPA